MVDFEFFPLAIFYGALTGLAFAITNLAAAWAALRFRFTPRTVLIPAAALGLVCWTESFLFADPPLTLALLLGLEMLKVAFILALAQRAAAGPLRFSLGEIMLVTTLAAGVLGVATLPALQPYLPSAGLIALGGTYSAITLGALWAALGRRPPGKLRWAILALSVVLGGYLLAAMIDPVGGRVASRQAQMLTGLFVFSLAWHAFIVAGTAWLWYMMFADDHVPVEQEANRRQVER